MLSSKVAKVARLRFFLWSLGWLHLDILKEVLENCTESMCQFGWRVLITYGNYSKLHVSFDKVSNGPTHKIISK